MKVVVFISEKKFIRFIDDDPIFRVFIIPARK